MGLTKQSLQCFHGKHGRGPTVIWEEKYNKTF